MKKKQTQKRTSLSERKAQRVVLGAVVIGALGALAIMVLVLPHNPGSQNGVGANGFSVHEIKGADLGIDKVVSKQDVQSALGGSAKSVEDVKKSGVISFNGNKGQTASYFFTSQKGTRIRIDVDLLSYKTKDAYDQDNVFGGTGSAGKINNLEVRYLPAATLGPEHEYALLVTKDLKSYKFSMSEPNDHIDVSELNAQEILKKIIAKSQL
jgi:hypothetical protein